MRMRLNIGLVIILVRKRHCRSWFKIQDYDKEKPPVESKYAVVVRYWPIY